MSRQIIHMKKNVRVWHADNSNSNKIYTVSEKDHENHSVINNTPHQPSFQSRSMSSH